MSFCDGVAAPACFQLRPQLCPSSSSENISRPAGFYRSSSGNIPSYSLDITNAASGSSFQSVLGGGRVTSTNTTAVR